MNAPVTLRALSVTRRSHRSAAPDPVEDRLAEWANWVLSGDPIQRADLSGWPAQGSARQQQQRGYIPPRVEEVEKAIAKLRLQSRIHKRVLFRRWLGRMSAEEGCVALRISAATFRRHLEEAQDFVARQLRLDGIGAIAYGASPWGGGPIPPHKPGEKP